MRASVPRCPNPHHRPPLQRSHRLTQPPEIAQAEDAIQKNDFAGAETLLKKALDKDPNNYQAWFDLGFVLNRLNRADESIAAYRKVGRRQARRF
jgi:Flp pilus assembly protein TadD